MKGVIGTIDLKTWSPRNLTRAVLEKVVSIYIAMRNRLPRVGDRIAPEKAIKTQIPEEERQTLKIGFYWDFYCTLTVNILYLNMNKNLTI